MRKQYLAQHQYKGYEPGKWLNSSYLTGGPKFLKSKEEAERANQKIIAVRNYRTGKTQHAQCGMFAISTAIDSETEHMFTVIRTRIRVREVTEWEDAE